MSLLDSIKSLKSRSALQAWIVALAADTIQVAFLPLFVDGAISPLDDALDIAVCIVLVRLLGWHWAFLPSLIAELVPGLDLFPTWTAAVWFVTRNSPLAEETKPQSEHLGQPEVLPPGPAPAPRR
jgi:hypothetical protein